MVLGFNWTCDIVALITIMFGLVYLVVGEGGKAFCLSYRKLQKERRRKTMREQGELLLDEAEEENKFVIKEIT